MCTPHKKNIPGYEDISKHLGCTLDSTLAVRNLNRKYYDASIREILEVLEPVDLIGCLEKEPGDLTEFLRTQLHLKWERILLHRNINSGADGSGGVNGVVDNPAPDITENAFLGHDNTLRVFQSEQKPNTRGLWNQFRHEMTEPAAIRARMAEDWHDLVRNHCEDDCITTDDLLRLGWTYQHITQYAPGIIAAHKKSQKRPKARAA